MNKNEREWRWEARIPVCKCDKPHLHAEDIEEFGEKVEALIAEERKRILAEVRKIVEKERSQYDESPRYHLNLEWGDAYTRACDHILADLDSLDKMG